MQRALVAILGLGLLASAAFAQFVTPAPAPPPGPNPFQANVGSAPRPPAPAATGQTAPAEGVAAPGRIDFGQWRSADPSAYGAQFQTQMRVRYAGRDRAAVRTDLEANGFGCSTGPVMQCRIEIMERGCAVDWYVVFEGAASEAIAGHDVMCLGAR